MCLAYSCHIRVTICCGTLSYSLCFNNQTDQGDEAECLEKEGDYRDGEIEDGEIREGECE